MATVKKQAVKSRPFPKAYTTETTQRNVITVRCPLQRNKQWEQWFLLTADRHWDNPHSDQELQREHLEQARECGAGVIDVGDLFCAMQGRWDKRSNKSALRPEHQVDNYLDALVTTAADFFAPYADQFVLVGHGNHETSVKKQHETDLIERLCGTLFDRTGHKVVNGGFGGWVKFIFRSPDNVKVSQSINLHYDHGAGGGGPVTKGVIQNNRRATYLPDAHIVISGHIHERNMMDYQRVRLSDQGKTYQDIQTHVIMPTYKEEYGDGFAGWHVERGAPPKPIGCTWLRFYWHPRHERVCWEVTWG